MGYPKASPYEGSLLEAECDVLVPCATEKAINADVASRIKAKVIVEGANGPTTPKAYQILLDKNVCVLAGRVVAGF